MKKLNLLTVITMFLYSTFVIASTGQVDSSCEAVVDVARPPEHPGGATTIIRDIEAPADDI